MHDVFLLDRMKKGDAVIYLLLFAFALLLLVFAGRNYLRTESFVSLAPAPSTVSSAAIAARAARASRARNAM